MKKKEIFGFLYAASVGAWATSLFISACYNNSIPMRILIIVMNIFLALKLFSKE